MSKIICDVCGTSYPETANQCPICGCIRSGDAVTVSGDTMQPATKPPAYTPVKGGRFSKANVRKRNSGKPLYNAESPVKPKRDAQPMKPNSAPAMPRANANNNKSGGHYSNGKPAQSKEISKKTEIGMIIAIVILLIAIAAVVIYIACSFLDIGSSEKNSSANQNTTISTDNGGTTTVPSGDNTTEPSGSVTTEPTVQQVPCTSVSIAPKQHTLNSVGGIIQLQITVEPANCTEEVQIYSDVEGIVSIEQIDNSAAVVTALSDGAVEITVECGDQSDTCRVICDISGAEPTDPPVVEPEFSQADLKFVDNGYGYEYTIPLSQGSFNPYEGASKIPAELVTFASNDENVATVDETGLITFVGKGRVEITATYNEWVIKAVLIVI